MSLPQQKPLKILFFTATVVIFAVFLHGVTEANYKADLKQLETTTKRLK